MTFVIPACAMIALKSLTLMTTWSFSSTEISPNSKVSTAIVVCNGCFNIANACQYFRFRTGELEKTLPFPDMIFSV